MAGPGPTLLAMVNGSVLEAPPPGAGFITFTNSVPSKAVSTAGTAAVNCVELTKLVASADPPTSTVEAATKFVPLTVSVRAAPPTAALFGERPVMIGTGFDWIGGGCLAPPPPQAALPKAQRSRKTSKRISRFIAGLALLRN